MNSRTLLNLALLVLVTAAALVAIYLPGLTKPAPLPALTTLRPSQVTHIEIQRIGQPIIRLVKQKGEWIMTEPLKLAASDTNVQSILDLTRAQSQTQFPANDHQLGKFKLTEPRVRLRLNDVEIAFGDTESLQQRRYVLLNNTVHLINESVYDRLIAEPTAWVSTALLPAASRPLEIDLPGLRLSKQKDGRWNLTPPAPGVSIDAINVLVDEWRHAQALQVRPDEKGPAQGKVLVRLQPQQDPASFEIRGRTPELILARPDLGVQYHFPAELAERLLQLPAPEAKIQPDKTADGAQPHIH